MVIGFCFFIIAPAMLWYLSPNRSCKHNWKILSKETTESALEQKSKQLTGKVIIYPTDTEKYLIQIVACDNCGKIKKFKDKL